MTVALYPGSFDPVTNGHLDIVRRAARLFDRIIVGVYSTPTKGKMLFTTSERVQMFQRAASDVPNMDVMSYQGLTATFAREQKAAVMVRGLRASSDFEFEFEMAMMNRSIEPEVDVVCLMSRLDYQFLSSSLLKEVAQLGGAIGNLVPQHVEAAMKERLQVLQRS